MREVARKLELAFPEVFKIVNKGQLISKCPFGVIVQLVHKSRNPIKM